MNETIQFIINGSQAIPLEITTITKTNWSQYILTIVISSFFLLFLLGQSILSGINSIITKISIYFFKKKNNIKHLMIIKHTTSDLFNQSMINQDTMKKVQEALIKFKGEDFDLLLWTPGGEIFSAEYISRIFKQYKGKIRSFVPIYSMSGGTLLTLSTDEIYMNDYSSLGCVDAQLGMLFGGFGSAKGWKEVLRIKKKEANDQSIIMNLMGKQYTKTIKENIKNLLTDKIQDNNQRKLFVDLLTSGDVQHALPLTKDILKSYGLQVKDIDDNTNIKLLKLLKRTTEGVSYS